MMRAPACVRALLAATLVLAARSATADSLSTDTLEGAGARPLASDRNGLFGRLRIGGYVDAAGEWAREDGVTTAFGANVRRWILLANTTLGSRVEVWSELELEEGGREVRLELAQVDVKLRRAASLRGGLLLLPLGRFNLAHDAPRLDLPDRPLLADRLLGVALAMPGFGGFGVIGPERGARIAWEVCTVTGFQDGLLTDSPDGTRLPAGRDNPEDANASPAWVARLECGHPRGFGAGVSAYRGAYNEFRIAGESVDDRRNVRVVVLDGEARWRALATSGEVAWVGVDLPPTFAGLFAGRQSGGWAEVALDLPRWTGLASATRLVARGDVVDFDRDRPGDSKRSITIGFVARPVSETAIKLAWVRGESRDRFDNVAGFARVQLGLATYF